jgi:UDPglucose--hexose-1-phosphate uridylyltransferase
VFRGTGRSRDRLIRMSFLTTSSHRRFNPLTGEWVLVSPQRTERPWKGQTEGVGIARPAHDPDCHLCPGNRRASGAVNPAYSQTLVFDNDFPALQTGVGIERMERAGLLFAEGEAGICRVVCFSPRHDFSLARMPVSEIERIVDTWATQYRSLGAIDGINAVQIFENRGATMGASSPHPHCQIWATRSLPNEVGRELASQTAYRERYGTPLLSAYLAVERELGERIVFANAHFTVLVPFWAIWPFETMLVPHRAVGALDELSPDEAKSLAAALSELTIRYDNLFQTEFPYSMGFHQRPTDGIAHPEWTLHAHFYPPLLRSATVRKFMVGFEMLGSPQRDITPEGAAERLRSQSATHYLDAEAPPPMPRPRID